MNPTEHIEQILTKRNLGLDYIEDLAVYPIDTIIPYFGKTNDSFIKPHGWYMKSENEKMIVLMGWYLKRLERNTEIVFVWGIPVDYTLKCWVINAMDMFESEALRESLVEWL
jgi:hypothetical protein